MTKALTYVKGSCHCKLNSFQVAFNTSQLPISNDLCHCSSCRHATGQMAINQVKVVQLLCVDSDEPFHIGKSVECDGDGDLIAYQTSKEAIRYFCSICSAHLFFEYLGKVNDHNEGESEGGYICVAVGALERIDGVVQPGFHQWIEDTVDGGLADHFRAIDGKPLPRYSREKGSSELPVGWRHQWLQDQRQDQQVKLSFSCHCKNVQFSITRPTEESSLPFSPYPDFLYPSDTSHLSRIRNAEDRKWWLRPIDSPKPTKYLAGHCVCSFCRLASGFEIQSWAYIPLANLVDKHGNGIVLMKGEEDDLSDVREAVEELGLQEAIKIPKGSSDLSQGQPKLPGLKQYISSVGRYREFCTKCGATVFAWHAGRPDLISVATALVDEEQDGSRAEGWFEWHMDRVGYQERGLSALTVDALMSGLRAAKADSARPSATQRRLSSASASISKKRRESFPRVYVEGIRVEA